MDAENNEILLVYVDDMIAIFDNLEIFEQWI